MYDITHVQRMFVEVCLTKKWSIGHLWCGQRLQTEEIKTLIKGHGVIESTQTIWLHRLEHEMSSFSECSMTRNVFQ